MRNTGARTSALILPVIAGVVLAAGCGGSSSSQSTSTADWADHLCSALSTWSSSVTSAASSLKGNPTPSSLKSTGKEVTSATDKLVDELKGLGKPDTKAGQQAKETVDKLSGQLKTDVDDINKAVDGASGTAGVLSAVSTVSATLATVGNQVSAAFSNLQHVDAKGELEHAFKQSDSCKSLTSQSS